MVKERRKREKSKLNGDNGNHSGHHYRVHGWPLSLIDPPERDTMPVTKSSLPSSCWVTPLLCCKQRVMGSPLMLNKSHTGNTREEVRTRSDRAATIWAASFQSRLLLLSCYVWAHIDHLSPLRPACHTDTASATISHFHHLLSSLPLSSPFISFL